MRSTRNVQPLNRGLIIGLAIAVILTIGVGRGSLGSEPFIIALYLIGAIVAAVAWSWDFRWKQIAWIVGVFALGYSMATMLLTAQYWLLVGAFVCSIVFVTIPALYKLNKQIERDRSQ